MAANWRSFSSARRGSVMPRSRTVKTFSSRTSNLEIDVSAGNSVPSSRRPKTIPRSFMGRKMSGEEAKLSTCLA